MQTIHRAIGVLLFGAALTACKAFPAGLYVDATVIEELERSRYYPDVRDTQIAGRMRVILDYDYGPWDGEREADRYYRLPGPVEGIEPSNFEPIATTWTDGFREGDLLLAKTARAGGLAMTLFMDEFCFFDHAAVLVQHEDNWHVCEAWPKFRKVGSSIDFASRFEGRVERVPLGEFLERYETVQLIRVTSKTKARELARAANSSLVEPKSFDPLHDPTNDEVSCTEYVAELLEIAGVNPPATVSITDNQFAQGVAYTLGYERTSYLMPDQFARLPDAVHVAWISRFDRRGDLLLQRECYRTLHEQFQKDGRLGDFLQPSRFHLMGYRPTVRAFERWSLGYFHNNQIKDTRRIRKVLDQIYEFCFVTKGLRHQ